MDRDQLETVSTRAYRLTKWGVEFSRGLTPAEFEELGRVLTRITNSMPWAVGDWMLAAEAMWNDKERYRLASEITGQPRARLAEYVRVSVSYEHRWRGLAPWSYFRAALALPESRRLEALAEAKERGLDLDAFRSLLRRKGAAIRRTARVGGDASVIGQEVVQCPKCGCRFGAGVGLAGTQRGPSE